MILKHVESLNDNGSSDSTNSSSFSSSPVLCESDSSSEHSGSDSDDISFHLGIKNQNNSIIFFINQERKGLILEEYPELKKEYSIQLSNKINSKQKKVIKIDANVIKKFEKQLESILTKIINDDFTQTLDIKACEWCDYKSICNK